MVVPLRLEGARYALNPVDLDTVRALGTRRCRDEAGLYVVEGVRVINQRPTTTTFNQTDGVDFDSSTNGMLYNAFLYTKASS